jgi:hypothetical protein
LEKLAGTIDEARMRHLNSEAERTKDYTLPRRFLWPKASPFQ